MVDDINVPLDATRAAVDLRPAIPPPELVSQMRAHLAGLPFRWDPYAPAGPVVLPWSLGRDLGEATRRLIDLIHRAVRRLGDSPQARHAALGMHPDLNVLYEDASFEDAYADIIARPDVVLTDTGWKFLEFNVSVSAGGQTYVHLLNQFWRQFIPATAESDRLLMADPLERRGDLMRTVAGQLGVAPRIAVIGAAADIGASDYRYYEHEVAELARAGFDAQYFEVSDYLDYWASGAKEFPLALQRMVPQDWVDSGRGVSELARIRGSGTALLAPQTAYQLSNKQVPAMLSEGQDWMSADDRDLADRYIPWTRRIVPGQVRYEGRTWELARLLAEQRERFVIKPPDKNSASGVDIGQVTEAAVWQESIDHAFRAGNWVVQEYVPPAPVPVDIVDVNSSAYVRVAAPAIFGPFLVGGELAGCWTRFDVLHEGGIIKLSGHRHVHMSSVAWNPES